jgi:hypothetical protein
MCFIQLEDLGYHTSTSIAMSYHKPSEDMRQLNAIAVLEIVTKKLRTDLGKPSQSSAPSEVRQPTERESNISKPKAYWHVKQSLRKVDHRASNDLAAALAEANKLRSALDKVEHTMYPNISAEDLNATQSVVDERDKKPNVVDKKNWKVELQRMDREMVGLKAKLRASEAESKRNRDLYELNEVVRGMYEHLRKRQKTA